MTGDGSSKFDLKSLAEKEFGQLSEVEEKLIISTCKGEPAICSQAGPDLEAPENDPANSKSWGPERTLRATLVQWLCTTPACLAALKLVSVLGARFEGRLDLSFASLSVPLVFRACHFPEGVILAGASLTEVRLTRSLLDSIKPRPWERFTITQALNARNLRVSGPVALDDGFCANGEATLRYADIGGALRCSGGIFHNPKGRALHAQGLKCRDVFLANKFDAQGEVTLAYAEIGILQCNEGTFNNPGGKALNAQGLKCRDVFLGQKFHATGQVTLFQAEIKGSLNCDGGKFEAAKMPSMSNVIALDLQGAIVAGSVRMSAKFEAKGEVRLLSARISANLICDGGTFDNPGFKSINLDAGFVGGVVTMRKGFTSIGTVSLYCAEVGLNMECDGAIFKNPGNVTLAVEGSNIKGSVLLRSSRFGGHNSFESLGEVKLFRTYIGGNLDCGGGKFENPAKFALNAEGARIKGAVFLRTSAGRAENFRSSGEVRFMNAEIGGNFECAGPGFRNTIKVRLNLIRAKVDGMVLLGKNFQCLGSVSMQGAHIGRALNIVDARFSYAASLNLSDAWCDVLADDPASWPNKGNLLLDGFVYNRLETPGDSESRLKWLHLQAPDESARREPTWRFWPQPYRQLSGVLKRQGHDTEAKAVLVGLAKDRRKWAELGPGSRAWQWILWFFIRNGHEPLRSFYFLIFLWVAGFFVFGWGYQQAVMVPSDKLVYENLSNNKKLLGHYEPFCAFVYAVDTALPLINFGQRDRWRPGAQLAGVDDTEKHGPVYNIICKASFSKDWNLPPTWAQPAALTAWLASFRYVYIALGWFFASMFAAGISGLVGRD